MSPEDGKKLFEWAAKMGIGISITFWESDGSWTVETISPAKAECLYVKRAISADNFIGRWNDNLNG